ncbi:MAG: FtsQ-type POTRA domain-containing protein [bacterium]|nr:FtsQ-type POTRA domain-containing protein [bacterium]
MLARWDYWRIKRIEFSGIVALEESLLRETVSEYLKGFRFGFLPNDLYFFINKESLTANLKEKFPRVEKIRVSKDFPDKLMIEISERGLFGILCERGEDQNCFLLDKEGVVYEEAPKSTGHLIPKVEVDNKALKPGAKVFTDDLIRQFEEASRASSVFTGSFLVSYDLFSKIPREIQAVNSEGVRLYLNTGDDFKKIFELLKAVLEKEIKEKRPLLDYVDLRFGNKIFYKFK